MILFLHGADTYRSRQRLRDIVEKFRKDVDPQGYNITRLDGNDATCQAVISALSAAPFLARKRMVVLEKYTDMTLKDEETESLAEAAKAALESDTVFVVWEEELDAKSKKDDVLKVVLSSKFVMEFASLDQQSVTSWMRGRLDAAGVTLDARAWAYVAMSVDDDVWLAASESDKLIAYAQGKGVAQLTADDVRKLVPNAVRDDVFALVDAVSQGRVSEALRRLHDQLKAGSHELEIVSLLLRQYRILQQVHDGLNEGLPPESIARLYKIHPFVVKKMVPQLRKINASVIRRGYQRLTELDKELKGSGIDSAVLISSSVARLAANAS